MTDYTVILTHNRHELLDQAVDAAAPQCDYVFVIDNRSEPPVRLPQVDGSPQRWEANNVTILPVVDDPPNLSRFWNLALDLIELREERHERWNVAFICDDVILPPDWYETVRDAMRSYGASAASAYSYREGNPYGEPYVLHHLSNGIDRMCPWAFMLPGEQWTRGAGMRPDERLKWWYCDTYVDALARRRDGTVIVPEPVADNLHPNHWTVYKPGLEAQAIADRNTFISMMGYA